MKLSVLIPAHDEAAYIGDCLSAVLASDPLPQGMKGEVLVLANGCSDDTAARARDCAVPGGWTLQVVEIKEGGKLNALNIGDEMAGGEIRVYLDADVTVDPPLLAELAALLSCPEPRYASGRPRVAPALSQITRTYARFWQRLPFFNETAPGFGLFAMNQAGRARWGDWPDIISDDTFARLSFPPTERHSAKAGYSWPMVEGFAALVRVRRRQDKGVAEIAERFPALSSNDDKPRLSRADLLKLAIRDPLGFATYAAVSLAVKSPFFTNKDAWARGR